MDIYLSYAEGRWKRGSLKIGKINDLELFCPCEKALFFYYSAKLGGESVFAEYFIRKIRRFL